MPTRLDGPLTMRRPLLISHDLSYSGAPIALLELATSLKRLGESPLVLTVRGGPLTERFRSAGIELPHAIDPRDISFVMANTILAVQPALKFKQFGIPIAAWLHESRYFFEQFRVSPTQVRLADLDVVLTPSMFQMGEFATFLPLGAIYQLRNTVQQPWFRPGGTSPTLAVCGQWELRKGQTQLVRLAEASKTSCRFRFIGTSAPPPVVVDSGALARHEFLGSLDPNDAKLAIAECGALVSCAEAEVQPLSVIEALMAGRPVLVSDIEAHRELGRLVPNVFLFDRLSSDSFGAGLRELGAAIADLTTARVAREKTMELYGTSAFDQRLVELLPVLRKDCLRDGWPPRMQR